MRPAMRGLVPVLVLVLTIAACGGSADPVATATPTSTAAEPSATPSPVPPTPTPTPTLPGAAVVALLAEAVEATLAAGTVSIAMEMEFIGSSMIPEGTSMTGSGVLAFTERRQAAMGLDMTDLGQGEMAIIIDEPTVWIRFTGPLGKQLGVDGQWVRIDETSTGAFADVARGAFSGPNDFSLLVYYLLGAGDDARVTGAAIVDSAATTEVTATLDLEAALDRVPVTVRDALVINIAEIEKEALQPKIGSVTWIDDEALVRKLQFDLALSSLQGGGIMRVTVGFTGHGEPLDLGIPPDDEVISVEEVSPPGG